MSVVSGCRLKGSVSEFNKWRVITALSIILPLVGRITGSSMSVIMRGSVTKKRIHLHASLQTLSNTPIQKYTGYLKLSEVLKAKADNNQVEKYLAPT